LINGELIDDNELSENIVDNQEKRQKLLEEGLQRSVTFELNFLREGASYASYAELISHKRDIDEKLYYTRTID
jgi:hypothetical protein